MSTAAAQPRDILASIDFSIASKAALAQAARLAKNWGSKLRILHVINSFAVIEIADARQTDYERQAGLALEGARTALEQWLAGLHLEVVPETILAVGTPAEAILEHADGTDLLVIGAVGTGNASWGSGSVGSKVLRKAAAPVLMVPPHGGGAFGTVLAAVDLSAHSVKVLQEAARIAQAEAAKLCVLHVWHQPWQTAIYFAAEAVPLQDESYGQLQADKLAAIIEKSGAETAETVLEEAAQTVAAIERHAARLKAGLVVIGAHGKSDLRHFFMGSTAENLLRVLQCAVLVAKAPAQ